MQCPKVLEQQNLMSSLPMQVQFEAPVIFLAPPSNIAAPVRNQPLFYVDGTDESYKDTRTLLPTEVVARIHSLSKRELVHTTDNQRASWVDLLVEVQRMERESSTWQKEQYRKNGPGVIAAPKFSERTLAVAIQAKKRSWEAMPPSVTKPYATTTLCHLVELTAVLGLCWKEFDRYKDRYRAEGNGYTITGSVARGFGLVFAFQKTGLSDFRANRIMPVEEIKQLCFGSVPTILFRKPSDTRRLDSSVKSPPLIELRFGSDKETSETFTMIGCNRKTANYFLKKGNVTHLFPGTLITHVALHFTAHISKVAFEVIGMLGRIIHPRGSALCMLPNPTIYFWDVDSFNPRSLLVAFHESMSTAHEMEKAESLRTIHYILEHLMHVINDRSPEVQAEPSVLDALHEALGKLDGYLTSYISHRELLFVVRAHFQVITYYLNNGSLFEVLDWDTPEQRARTLMKIYFEKIRLDVLNSRGLKLPFHHPFWEPESSSVYAIGTLGETGEDESHGQWHTIWCALVLRMLCWLSLHGFQHGDIQIPKSEAMGNRQPVYIV